MDLFLKPLFYLFRRFFRHPDPRLFVDPNKCTFGDRCDLPIDLNYFKLPALSRHICRDLLYSLSDVQVPKLLHTVKGALFDRLYIAAEKVDLCDFLFPLKAYSPMCVIS